MSNPLQRKLPMILLSGQSQRPLMTSLRTMQHRTMHNSRYNNNNNDNDSNKRFKSKENNEQEEKQREAREVIADQDKSSPTTTFSSTLSSPSLTTFTSLSDRDDQRTVLLSQQTQMMTSQQQEIVQSEQKLLGQLLQVIRAVDDVSVDSRVDCSLVESSREQLQDFFLVVCVGEFNAGKSSFINALLGDRYVKEGITPTTTALHMIKYGGNMKQEQDDQRGVFNIELPLRWLKGLSLVDTPGTNAVVREHQHITETFVPRSDLIIFLTSAERPFSESEREFMEMIREWGKKLVVVINKVDLLENDADRKTVETFVKKSIASLLGFEPEVFCISAKNALREKLELQYSKFAAGLNEQDNNSLSSNNAAVDALKRNSTTSSYQWLDLETHILKTLNSMERVQIKLENPLGVVDKLSSKYQKVIEQHLSTLQEDKKTIDIIEKQLELFREEMIQDFNLHHQRLQNVFHELLDRSNIFFDEFLTWQNVRNFFNNRKIEERFNREVIADFIPQIEQVISDIIDWILDRRYRQWKAVMDFVQKRTRITAADESDEKLVGSLRSEFNYNRKELLLSIGKSAESVVRTYDRREDVDRLNKSISSSLSSAGILAVGAITLGSASFSIMSTLMTSTLGIAGAAITLLGAASVLPYKRGQSKRQFKAKVNGLHTRLRSVLQDKFIEELDDGIESIRNAIAPYSRFVKMENNKFETQNAELENVRRKAMQLRTDIHKLVNQGATTTTTTTVASTHPLRFSPTDSGHNTGGKRESIFSFDEEENVEKKE